MSTQPHDPAEPTEEPGHEAAPGVESTSTDDGSTFEPEEDPEGHAD